mmetsp:Transcript_248/g.519  ORF Transcript_248/g.519 Transcript_248/m.519 type:complete len:337 (+) Transcript_248:918-1928(+)
MFTFFTKFTFINTTRRIFNPSTHNDSIAKQTLYSFISTGVIILAMTVDLPFHPSTFINVFILKNHFALSMLLFFLNFTFVNVTIRMLSNARSIDDSFLEGTFICPIVNPREHAFAMLLVINPVTIIGISRSISVFSFSMVFIILKTSFVSGAICEYESTFAMLFTIQEVTFIHIPIRKYFLANTSSHSSEPFTIVRITFFRIGKMTFAVTFAVDPLTFVNVSTLFVVHLTKSMSTIVNKGSNIGITIGVSHFTLAIHGIFFPKSIINFAIIPAIFSFSMLHIGFEFSNIFISVLTCEFSFTIHHVIGKSTRIYVTRGISIHTKPVHFSLFILFTFV